MPVPRGEFLAMSVFYYALHCLHELGPMRLEAWPKPSLRELREAAQDFCAMDWEYMMHEDEEKGKARASHKFTTSVDALAHRCMETVYMTTLLRDGYGFPEHSRNVTYALNSNGMEVEWTLGFALAELARHYEAEAEEWIEAEPERVEAGEVNAAGVSHPGAHESICWKAMSSPDCERRPVDGSPDDNHTDSAMAFLKSSHAAAAEGTKRGKRRRRCHSEGVGDDRASSSISLLWCDVRGTCWFEESDSGSGGDRIVPQEVDRLDPVVGASPKACSAPGAAREAEEREEEAVGDNSAEDDTSGFGRAAKGLFNTATTLISTRSSTWWDFLTGAGMITSPSLTRKGYSYDYLEQANERDLWALVQGWTVEAVKWTGFTMGDPSED